MAGIGRRRGPQAASPFGQAKAWQAPAITRSAPQAPAITRSAPQAPANSPLSGQKSALGVFFARFGRKIRRDGISAPKEASTRAVKTLPRPLRVAECSAQSGKGCPDPIFSLLA